MQLLDEEHLLLKYASEDVVTLRAAEPNTQPAFFVVYNMETAEVRKKSFIFTFFFFAKILLYATFMMMSIYINSSAL